MYLIHNIYYRIQCNCHVITRVLVRKKWERQRRRGRRRGSRGDVGPGQGTWVLLVSGESKETDPSPELSTALQALGLTPGETRCGPLTFTSVR